MSKVISNDLLVNEAGGLYYKDRQYVNTFAGENTEFQSSGSYTNLEQRVAFFTSAYSDSPGMVMNIVGAGAKYPATSRDADGNYLDGGKTYKMTLPADVPAALFWSVTAYDGLSASGMPNGQAFPSLNQMDKPSRMPMARPISGLAPPRQAQAKKTGYRPSKGRGCW